MTILQERALFVWCGVPLILLHVTNYIMSGSQQLFSLITANTLITHTYVWNVVTCCFFETSLAKLIVDLVLLWFLSGHIGIPNVEQFGLYFTFSILTCSIGTSLLCFLRFVGTGHEYPLLAASFGFSGILITLLMFVRQNLRNQSVHHKYFTALNYHFAPTLYVATQFSLRLIGLRSFGEDITFTTLSLLYSWSYLKFFYKYTENEAPGDRGEDFSFVGMFPEPFHIVLVPFTTAFYNLMALLGIFPPLEQQERKFHQHHLRVSTSTTPPVLAEANEEGNAKVKTSKADIVAERRKARAIKMLDAKLAELAKEVEGWDDVTADAIADNDKANELSRFKV